MWFSNILKKYFSCLYALIVAIPLIEDPSYVDIGERLEPSNFIHSFVAPRTFFLMKYITKIITKFRIVMYGMATQTIINTAVMRNKISKNHENIVGSTISPTLTSLEKRFSIRPTGFWSKKDTLPLAILLTI